MFVEKSPRSKVNIDRYSCFGSAMILSLAALSPALSEYVPHITELQNMAIARLKPWAQPRTSIECALEILVALQTKMRYR